MTQTQEPIRAFIALALPASVTDALGGVCQQWAERWPEAGVRWVPSGNIHMTLRFLGNIDRAQIDSLRLGMNTTAGLLETFELALGTVGAFPNKQRARVVWVGPVAGEEALMELKDGLERSLVAQGWAADERPFRPHLTIGRVRKEAQVPAQLWDTEVAPVAFRATRLQLIESRLMPKRAEYHLLHEVDLAKA